MLQNLYFFMMQGACEIHLHISSEMLFKHIASKRVREVVSWSKARPASVTSNSEPIA
jgi:hypothetical protein